MDKKLSLLNIHPLFTMELDSMAPKFSRRRFLKGAMVGAALIPLVNLDTRRAFAADKVPEDDPMAQALKYVEAS